MEPISTEASELVVSPTETSTLEPSVVVNPVSPDASIVQPQPTPIVTVDAAPIPDYSSGGTLASQHTALPPSLADQAVPEPATLVALSAALLFGKVFRGRKS